MVKRRFNLYLSIFMQISFILMASYVINLSNSSYLAFQRINFGNSTIVSSTTPEISWVDNGTLIFNETNDQIQLISCSDGEGGAIFAWRDYRDDDGDIYAQRIFANGSVAWTSGGVAVDARPERENIPDICSDGNGGAIITYQHWDASSSADIWAQRINSTGGFPWGSPKPICIQSNFQYYPKICTDGDGGGIITWQDFRDSYAYYTYAQRINNSGGIEWISNGVIIGKATHPQICSDGEGGAIIVVEYNLTSPDFFEIYGQRINASGLKCWGAGKRIGYTSSNDDSLNPCIYGDGQGNACIVWETYSYDYYGVTTEIRGQRIDMNGTSYWSSNGITISTQSYEPEICGDGAGGVIIAWRSYTEINGTSSYNIYAQKINSDCTIAGPVTGIAICTANDSQQNAKICSDGYGGAIITWEDYRNEGYDIYAQIIDSTGEIQGTYNGIPICRKGNNQTEPQICGDGNGNAIISWIDYRDGANSDIYTQRICYIPDQVPSDETQALLIIPQESQDILNSLLSPLGLGIIGGIAAYGVIATVLLWRKLSETKKEIRILKKESSKKTTSKEISKG